MQNFSSEHILSVVRSGDFGHPGGIGAIDIVVRNFPRKSKIGRLLDVGCGLGATSEYMRRIGFANTVFGFDIEKNDVNYARENFPRNNFFVADVMKIDKKTNLKFDAITVYNVFFCIYDQETCLKRLFKVAEKSCDLMIFDYVNNVGVKNRLYYKRKECDSCCIPIELSNFRIISKRSGWAVEKLVDLTDEYEIWYSEFLKKLDEKYNVLCKKFGKLVVETVKNQFLNILNSIEAKETGGIIVYCRKIEI